MQAQLAEAQTVKPEPKSVTLTEDEKEQFGPEFVNVMSKIVDQKTEAQTAEIASLVSKITEMSKGQETLRQDVQIATGDQLRMEIGRRTQDKYGKSWNEANTDAGFNDFLDGTERFSKEGPRRKQIAKAFGQLDVDGVMEFFDVYFSSSKQTSSEAEIPKASSVPDELIQKDTKRGGNTPVKEDDRVWSMPELNKFYDECARGAWDGKTAEKEKINAAIIKAAAEGRVR
jgi:hypothetical protein